eukprot:GHVT01060354.1.p1 GENE.GHVT01060354.1~~GHVT01060354.1.p1  ORF type:complete len:887 (-),score=97.49 GHVT01060354.1:6074-8629(-)
MWRQQILQNFEERMELKRDLIELERLMTENKIDKLRGKLLISQWEDNHDVASRLKTPRFISSMTNKLSRIDKTINSNLARKQEVDERLRQNLLRAEHLQSELPNRVKNDDMRAFLQLVYRSQVLAIENTELQDLHNNSISVIEQKNLEVENLQLQLRLRDEMIKEREALLTPDTLDHLRATAKHPSFLPCQTVCRPHPPWWSPLVGDDPLQQNVTSPLNNESAGPQAEPKEAETQDKDESSLLRARGQQSHQSPKRTESTTLQCWKRLYTDAKQNPNCPAVTAIDTEGSYTIEEGVQPTSAAATAANSRGRERTIADEAARADMPEEGAAEDRRDINEMGTKLKSQPRPLRHAHTISPSRPSTTGGELSARNRRPVGISPARTIHRSPENRGRRRFASSPDGVVPEASVNESSYDLTVRAAVPATGTEDGVRHQASGGKVTSNMARYDGGVAPGAPRILPRQRSGSLSASQSAVTGINGPAGGLRSFPPPTGGKHRVVSSGHPLSSSRSVQPQQSSRGLGSPFMRSGSASVLRSVSGGVKNPPNLRTAALLSTRHLPPDGRGAAHLPSDGRGVATARREEPSGRSTFHPDSAEPGGLDVKTVSSSFGFEAERKRQVVSGSIVPRVASSRDAGPVVLSDGFKPLDSHAESSQGKRSLLRSSTSFVDTHTLAPSSRLVDRSQKYHRDVGEKEEAGTAGSSGAAAPGSTGPKIQFDPPLEKPHPMVPAPHSARRGGRAASQRAVSTAEIRRKTRPGSSRGGGPLAKSSTGTLRAACNLREGPSTAKASGASPMKMLGHQFGLLGDIREEPIYSIPRLIHPALPPREPHRSYNESDMRESTNMLKQAQVRYAQHR